MSAAFYETISFSSTRISRKTQDFLQTRSSCGACAFTPGMRAGMTTAGRPAGMTDTDGQGRSAQGRRGRAGQIFLEISDGSVVIETQRRGKVIQRIERDRRRVISSSELFQVFGMADKGHCHSMKTRIAIPGRNKRRECRPESHRGRFPLSFRVLRRVRHFPLLPRNRREWPCPGGHFPGGPRITPRAGSWTMTSAVGKGLRYLLTTAPHPGQRMGFIYSSRERAISMETSCAW